MSVWNDPVVHARAVEISKFINSTNVRLKKIFKFSDSQIALFWRHVDELIKNNPEAVTEDEVNKLIKDFKRWLREQKQKESSQDS